MEWKEKQICPNYAINIKHCINVPDIENVRGTFQGEKMSKPYIY